MNIEECSTINNFIDLIEKSDFSVVSYPCLPAPSNQRIIEILSSFIRDYLTRRSSKHPLVDMALKHKDVDSRELPLFPIFKLKILAVILSHLDEFDKDISDSFKKKLASYRTFSQVLFELQVGFILKKNDADIEFYEVENPSAVYPPDFLGTLESGKIIWIDAFVRKREKDFFDHFDFDNRMHPIPKEQEEIEEILKEFVRTTCTVISKKRKKSIADSDIFIAVVRVSDGYSSGSIDYQAFVNSLNSNNIIVVFKGPTGLYAVDGLAKDNIAIYFNQENELSEEEVRHIKHLFS